MGINLGQTSMKAVYLGQTAVKSVFFGSNQVWGGEEPAPVGNWLRFDILADDTSIDIVDDSGTLETPDLEYSVDDGETWTQWVPGSDFPHEMAGAVVYVRAGATGNTGFADINNPSAYWHFTSDDLFSVSGNIMSLLSRDGSTGLSECCFYRLFDGCTMLVDASSLELPATTLADYCYQGMFRGCTSLTAAPELPATILADFCYSTMLSACTSLTAAPELPATTLANNCYQYMFRGCTSLTAAPELPATTLADFCYASMFSGCSSLSSVDVAFTAWSPSNATNNWLNNVAASGTFKCPEELSDIRDASHIPTEWQVEKPLYIQNGLICWYDGIDNAGEGQHSSDTTTWKNLGSLGSTYDAIRSAGTWQSNGAVFQEDNQSQRFDIKNALMSSQMQGEWTYEIVFTPTANWFKNYNGLLGNHEGNAPAGIDGGQYENGNIYFSVIGRGITGNKVVCWQASQSYLNQYVGTLNTVACAASTTSGTAKTWHNGDLKNTVSSSSFTLRYTADFFIGAAFPAYDRVFDGVIHCLRIYNRPLTESEHLHNRAVDLQRFGSAQNDWLCFTAEEANSTVHLDKVGSPNTIYLETSTDGSSWTDYEWSGNTGDTLTLTNIGDKVYMRAKTENPTIGSAYSNYYKFVMTGQIAASGNIQTLLKADGSRTDAPTYCYKSMFDGCTSLTTAPALPATTLAKSCYQSMFAGCSSLTTAPALPATALAEGCYNDMFHGCAALTTAPALPATTLASQCYYQMFNGCTSLTTAPELPATTFVGIMCYYGMFYNCTSLSSMEVAFTDWNSSNAHTNNWLYNVAASGTFTCPAELPDTRGVSNIPTGWTKVDAKGLKFVAEENNSTIGLKRVGSPPTVYLLTSDNGVDWNQYTIGDSISLPNAGDHVYFKAAQTNNSFASGDYSYNNFFGTGKVGAYGNIEYLRDENASLTSLSQWAYKSLFAYCSALTHAPELTISANVPYGAYNYMFANCTSLSTGPSVIPSQFIYQYGCVGMFEDCSALTAAPEISATYIAEGAFSRMFNRCTSLVKAPSHLYATAIAGRAGYDAMFRDCQSLTASPIIDLTSVSTAGCCTYMFCGCTNLQKVEVPNLTQWTSGTTNYWLSGVAETGEFICPAELPDTRGASNIPEGWTKVDAA